MIELPFHAKIDDKLAVILRHITAEHRRDTPDALPSITWSRYNSGPRAGTSDWSLQSLSSKFLQTEDIFTVGDISVHIGADERHRLASRVLDWSEKEGLVTRENAV
jgi:hypothetical protein